MLISELSFALHDAIQAGQMVHSEQRALDIGRKALAEESSVVRATMSAISSMRSYLTIENFKNERLQARIKEGRKRFEQRLTLAMSNPASKDPSVHSVDVVSKVEIQALRQELNAAQSFRLPSVLNCTT